MYLFQDANNVNPFTRPAVSYISKERMKLATQYMQTDFPTVHFTDKWCATLNRPDGRSKSWVATGGYRSQMLRWQQSKCGVILACRIIGAEMVSPWRILDSVKMTAQTYIDFF